MLRKRSKVNLYFDSVVILCSKLKKYFLTKVKKYFINEIKKLIINYIC